MARWRSRIFHLQLTWPTKVEAAEETTCVWGWPSCTEIEPDTRIVTCRIPTGKDATFPEIVLSRPKDRAESYHAFNQPFLVSLYQEATFNPTDLSPKGPKFSFSLEIFVIFFFIPPPSPYFFEECYKHHGEKHIGREEYIVTLRFPNSHGKARRLGCRFRDRFPFFLPPYTYLSVLARSGWVLTVLTSLVFSCTHKSLSNDEEGLALETSLFQSRNDAG